MVSVSFKFLLSAREALSTFAVFFKAVFLPPSSVGSIISELSTLYGTSLWSSYQKHQPLHFFKACVIVLRQQRSIQVPAVSPDRHIHRENSSPFYKLQRSVIFRYTVLSLI